MFGLFRDRPSSREDTGEAIHAVLGSPITAAAAAGQGDVVFGCGCFWGAEKGFWRLPGVITTAVGYAGGPLAAPSYEQVCSGRSGHAEVVRVVWDEQRLGFADLLKLFWECHDPTQGDRQGNDRGSQYRSVIYTTTPAQFSQAQASLNQYQQALQSAGFGTITTELGQGKPFHYAETYHQQYLAKPGSRPYCSAQPTRVPYTGVDGQAFLLPASLWKAYDWSVPHCVLRGDNAPIPLP